MNKQFRPTEHWFRLPDLNTISVIDCKVNSVQFTCTPEFDNFYGMQKTAQLSIFKGESNTD